MESYSSDQDFDIEACWEQDFPSLLELLKKQEGFRTSVYKCTSNVVTIGYGHNMQRGESSKKVFKAIGVSWDKVFKGEKNGQEWLRKTAEYWHEASL